MSLSDDQIKRLARLARIAIRPEETAEVGGRLNRVLSLVDEMRAVDTSGIEPMSHALDLVQRLRPDEVTEADRRADYQALAPAVEDGLYLVPKVIEGYTTERVLTTERVRVVPEPAVRAALAVADRVAATSDRAGRGAAVRNRRCCSCGVDLPPRPRLPPTAAPARLAEGHVCSWTVRNS